MAKAWFRDLLIPMKPTESTPPTKTTSPEWVISFRETFFIPLLRLYLFFFLLFCLGHYERECISESILSRDDAEAQSVDYLAHSRDDAVTSSVASLAHSSDYAPEYVYIKVTEQSDVYAFGGVPLDSCDDAETPSVASLAHSRDYAPEYTGKATEQSDVYAFGAVQLDSRDDAETPLMASLAHSLDYAPEYVYTGKATEQSDVYAFGAVQLDSCDDAETPSVASLAHSCDYAPEYVYTGKATNQFDVYAFGAVQLDSCDDAETPSVASLAHSRDYAPEYTGKATEQSDVYAFGAVQLDSRDDAETPLMASLAHSLDYAPEYVYTGKATHQSDVYAFGAVQLDSCDDAETPSVASLAHSCDYAPEYVYTGKATEQSDVYAFGAVQLDSCDDAETPSVASLAHSCDYAPEYVYTGKATELSNVYAFGAIQLDSRDDAETPSVASLAHSRDYAPEYVYTGKATEQSDVYAFGAVQLDSRDDAETPSVASSAHSRDYAPEYVYTGKATDVYAFVPVQLDSRDNAETPSVASLTHSRDYAPEYVYTGKATEQSDVYAFGAAQLDSRDDAETPSVSSLAHSRDYAPEYVYTGKATEQSDVYAFGAAQLDSRDDVVTPSVASLAHSRDYVPEYMYTGKATEQSDVYAFGEVQLDSHDDAETPSAASLAHISIHFGILRLLLSLPSPRHYIITSFDPPLFVLDGLLFSYYCLIGLSLHLSVQILKKFMKPTLKTLVISLKNNCIISVSSKFQSGKNREQKPLVELVEFDSTNNRAYRSILLVEDFYEDFFRASTARSAEKKRRDEEKRSLNSLFGNAVLVKSDKTNAREASKGLCMTEGVRSLVDSTTRISSTDFDAPDNSAHLVRANQSGPIMLNSEKNDTSEGLIGECLTESVLSLDDSAKRKSFPDFDAAENKAHLVRAYQSGPVVSLSENKNEGEALKKDLQLHCGGRSDAAAKSFRAICDLGLHTTDSITWKSFEVLETLRPREQQSNATDTDRERQIQTQMCNELVSLLSLRRLTLKGCVRQDKSPCFPRLLQINAVEQKLTQSPRYSGGLIAQSAGSSRWPIGLQDGAHIMLLDPLKQSAKNVAYAVRQDQCSLTVSLREKKMVRRKLKRNYRTISVIFEYHQQHFGRRCEGAVKSFGATRHCRKHGIRQVSTVKCIHKQHWIHRWPFRQKWATRNWYSLRDERPFGASKLSMDEKLDSWLLFIQMSQFARLSPQPLGLLDGCVIVGPIASSSSEFAATNNRAHFVRQDQSCSTASCREGKSARETLDKQGITMSLCIVDDLQQHFGGKHKDAMKRLGVNISMFKSTCRLHQFYLRPCWNEKNEQVFDARNNRTPLAKADQSGPTKSNSKKENTREALKRECVTSRVLRHLVRQRTLTHKHCVRRKKSQDLPRSLHMDCSGGLASQKSTRSLHWPLGLPDGGPIITHSEKKILRNTFKRKCRSMSVGFEDHQQHFCSRCEGAANSLGAKRNCKRHGINLVSTAKRIHRQHGIHRCPFRQGYSLGGERPAEVISLSMDEKLVSRLQFLHMFWLAGSSLYPFALRSGREIEGYIAFSSSEFAATKNRAHPGGQDRCGSSASHPENERTKETKNREGTASRIISREVLEQHFGRKREDVAKILGYSVSTFKRVCRDHGIPQWPNWRSNSVPRPPDPHGEKNPSPTVNTLSTNAQIMMEMGGQNSEPNECLPDSFEDPNFQNTGTCSIAEFGKTPTFHDSLLGHCRDADICFPAVYSETDAAGGSSKWAFPLEGQTTLSTASPYHNALVFPQSQIASTKVLYQNIGSAEDKRDLLASQVEAYLEGHVSESSDLTFPACSELMFQQKNQSMQFAAYPNPNGLVDPHPHMASTQKISENMESLDDRRNLLALQKEPPPEGHVFGSVNWTVGSCSSLALSQPMPTIPHTTGSSEFWRNSLAFAEGHLSGENLYRSFNLTVPPCSDPASQPMPTIHHTMATIPHMMPLLIERPDMRSVKLKATYGDTTIKFQLPLTSGINELKEEVSKILECKLGSFNVEYKDEDGDWILMARDENLSEYLQLLTSLRNQVTKLKLRDKVPHTTNFCDNCGCHNCRSMKQKRP